MLLCWPSLALQAGEEQQALEGAAAACRALPASSAVWEQRLALEARHASLQVWTCAKEQSTTVMSLSLQACLDPSQQAFFTCLVNWCCRAALRMSRNSRPAMF